MDFLVVIGVVVAVIVAFAILFAVRYKTVGADDAMIVTGSFLGSKNVHKTEDGGGIKIVRGGGASYFLSSNEQRILAFAPIAWTFPHQMSIQKMVCLLWQMEQLLLKYKARQRYCNCR